MKTYKFAVSLCGGWCNGDIEVAAENEEVAYDKAMDMVSEKLVEAFPTLDIEYNVECENPDDEENYTAFKCNSDGITLDLARFYEKECAIKYAQRWGWHKVVNDNTGEVVWRK